MGIDALEAGVSVGEGVLDIALIKWDESAIKGGSTTRSKPFQGSTDIGRLIAALGGYAAWAMAKGSTARKVGEALAIATTPLLIHSIWSAVQKTPGAPVVRYAPRRSAVSSPIIRMGPGAAHQAAYEVQNPTEILV